jgi:hypothetical protein
MRLAVALLPLALVAALAGAEPVPSIADSLTAASFPAWRDHLALRPVETLWASIPWEADLGRALARATVEDKPVVAWVECGNPLSNV